MKPGEIKIYDILVNTPDGLTFTELKNATSLSAPVLSEYLAIMQKHGVVVKELKARKYKLAQIFFPMKTFPNEYQKAMKIFVVALVKTALQISKIKEKKVKEEAFKRFLRNTFYLFMVVNWKIIGEGVGVFGEKMKVLKREDSLLEMNSIINQAFQDWVAPIANALAIAIANNWDVIEVGEQFFNEVQKEATEKIDKLIQDVRVAS